MIKSPSRLTNEKTERFFSLGLQIRHLFSPLLFSIILEVLVSAIRGKKRYRGGGYIQIENKNALYSQLMLTFYMWKSKRIYKGKKVIRTGEFSKVARSRSEYKINRISTYCQWTTGHGNFGKLSFTILSEVMKYLDINLTRATTYLSCNYKILMKENEDLWLKPNRDISCAHMIIQY